MIVTNDAVTAYLGALGERAGSGDRRRHRERSRSPSGPDGQWARADGWGTLLGDAGGGYWIGRRALELALRAADGRGGSPELLRRARPHGEHIIRAVYDAPDPTATIAALHPRRSPTRSGAAAAISEAAGPRARRRTAARPRPRGPAAAPAGGLTRAARLAAPAGPGRGGVLPRPASSSSRRSGPSPPGLVPASRVRAPLGDGLAGAARLAAGTTLFRVPRPRSCPMTRLGHLSTETARAERAEIDRLPTAELVRLMNEDDAAVAAGGRGGAQQIARRWTRSRRGSRRGGRLIYSGAGTAGGSGCSTRASAGRRSHRPVLGHSSPAGRAR